MTEMVIDPDNKEKFIPIDEAREKLNQGRMLGLKGGIRHKGLKLDNYEDNVKYFYNTQPFFYDRNEIFWFWNAQNDRWEILDEIDLMNLLDHNLDFYGQTIGKGVKNNYMEAFKRIGRLRLPKDAPKKWIQFKDKAFSLTSKKIHTVTPDYFFCNPIPFELGQSSDTPTMDKLFEEWVGADYVQSLYELIAYCCYTDYPIQTLICLFGGGRNGKTSFLKLLNRFIGLNNICSTELDVLLDSRFESFKMYRKLVCEMGETNFSVLDKSSILKKLVGSDLIGYEIKGKTPFSDYNYAKMIIASNSLPSSNDTSDGFYRRWFIIDFPNEFPEGKDIILTVPEIEFNNLAKKVTEILPKLLEAGKFDRQGTIKERKVKYEMSSNPLPLFLKKYTIRDSSYFVGYGELYTRYVQFLFDNKRRRIKKKEFMTAMEDEGFWLEKTSKKINDEFIVGLWFIGLKFCSDCAQKQEILTQHMREAKEVENQAKQAQNTQKQDIFTIENNFPQETEVIEPLKWDEKQLHYLKCQVEGCNEAECNLDSKGVPYCKLHWDECACK